MHQTLKRVKTSVLGAVLAVAAVASPIAAPVATQAPSLTVSAADNDNYAKLLQYSLYFYDGNMCGDTVDSHSAFSWRGNCHTSDEVPGGYHDAGDHAVFGLPQGWASSMIGWAYYEFPDSFDSLGLTDHFKTIFHHFTDYYKASTVLNGDTVSKLLYQKGDGDADHAYWGAPEAQGGSRQMFWTSNGSSDVAAHYAATLAQDYMFFGDKTSLDYAKALYKFSKQYNQVTSGGHEGFYSSKYNESCADEQAWAAGWMYLATKDESYKNDCVSKVYKPNWTHSWGSSNLGASIIAAEITKDWGSVLPYISGKCSGSNYLCMDGWGSARYNCGMQFFGLVAQKNGQGNFSSWAQGQMNYLLGNNPMNVCFVAGYASNSPTHYHHRASSGMTDVKSSEPNRNVLVGALIGGPNASGYYADNREEYETNEVALDYQANLVCAAAALYHQFKTGSVDTNIAGVGSVNPTPITVTTTKSNPDPIVTTTKYNPDPIVTTSTKPKQDPDPTGNDIVLYPEDMTVDTEKGDDGKTNNYAEFAPQGAKSATLYVKVNSSDTEISGEFGTWTGEWEEDKFEAVKVGSDKIATVDYVIPSNVGSVVKAIVWWPHGNDVEIQKVVLHKDGASQPKVTTTKATTTKPVTTSTTTKPVTQPVTQPQTQPQTEPATRVDVKLYGDATNDGDLRMNDVVLILQVISNPDRFDLTGYESTRITPQGKVNADCYRPGSGITPQDALAVQRALLKSISLPTDN